MEEGVYASGVSSVLSYFSLNSKCISLKPFTSLTILQEGLGPWRSMCLLKCEVPQTARHQIIAEGEMLDSYFSLLTLLSLSSETVVVYFLTVALSTCHLDVGFVPLHVQLLKFHV